MTIYSLYGAGKSVKQAISGLFAVDEMRYREELVDLSRADKEKRERESLRQPSFLDKILDSALNHLSKGDDNFPSSGAAA